MKIRSLILVGVLLCNLFSPSALAMEGGDVYDTEEVLSDTSSSVTTLAETVDTSDIISHAEPDFTPTPPKLKFIKVQLEDSTQLESCQTGAEFAVVMNFGSEAVDLVTVQFQTGKVGNSTADFTKDLASKTLMSGHSLVLYNNYFVDKGSGCLDNQSSLDWLATQTNAQLVRTLKSGMFQNNNWARLTLKDSGTVIDQVDLSQIRSDQKHDSLVAQTNASGEILLSEHGSVLWRSLRAHIPEQHWLNYGSLVIFEDEPEPVKNLCQGLVISELVFNSTLDKQFVEIYNETDEIIDLMGCQLWTNWSGANKYVFGDIELADRQYLAIFLKDTKLQLAKTDIARVELRNEPGVVVDAVEFNQQVANSGWSLINSEFIKSFALTPNLPNLDMPELPCSAGYVFNQNTGTCQRIGSVSDETDEDLVCAVGYEVGFTGTCVKVCNDGYERNPDTNRCRKIVVESESVLAPCPIGYYRNPETNRCRKITTTTQAGLSPCPIGYERNPDTNRCRKISNQQDCDSGYEIGFTGTCVKVCEDGYERSPETNRCRKLVAQASQSDLAGAFSTPEDDSSNMPFVQLTWWQFGLLAVGVGGFVAFRNRDRIKQFVKKKR